MFLTFVHSHLHVCAEVRKGKKKMVLVLRKIFHLQYTNMLIMSSVNVNSEKRLLKRGKSKTWKWKQNLENKNKNKNKKPHHLRILEISSFPRRIMENYEKYINNLKLGRIWSQFLCSLLGTDPGNWIVWNVLLQSSRHAFMT